MRNDRNYWLALFLCLGITVLSMMGENAAENWKWYFLSDLNVAMFLFIAWLFDSK